MKSRQAVAAVALVSTTSAAITQKCASSNLCFSLNIPDSTASSGNGDIFFQITAPTSMQWAALGQGSGMSGSNIFVIYTDATGSNVTISPRIGTGRVEPDYSNAAQVTLLDGTGVADGIMTANVRCSNCNSWQGGSMDFSASSASWIYASKSGSALNTNDQSASISRHDNKGSFSFDLKAAAGGNDVNPFASSGAAATGAPAGSAGTAAVTGASSCKPRPASGTRTTSAASSTTAGFLGTAGSSTTVPNGFPYPTNYGGWPSTWPGWGPGSWPTGAPPSKRADSDDEIYCDEEPNSSSGSTGSSNGSTGSSSGSAGSSSFIDGSLAAFGGGAFQRETRILMAHGILASLAFVILFPSGAIAIRLLSFPGLVWLHAAIQVLGWLTYIAAFGLGIYLATNLRMLNNAHPIIGIVLFILLAFQPILGLLHHTMFKKYSRRTFWSYAHLWLGRIIITLGIINGGLGLNLADNTTSGKIAYAVVAAVMFSAFVAASVYGEIKRARRQRSAPPPSYSERVASSSEASPERREYYGKPERT